MKVSITLLASDRGITPVVAVQAAKEQGLEHIYHYEHTHILNQPVHCRSREERKIATRPPLYANPRPMDILGHTVQPDLEDLARHRGVPPGKARSPRPGKNHGDIRSPFWRALGPWSIIGVKPRRAGPPPHRCDPTSNRHHGMAIDDDGAMERRRCELRREHGLI